MSKNLRLEKLRRMKSDKIDHSNGAQSECVTSCKCFSVVPSDVKLFLNLISKSMALLFFSRVNAPLWGPWASDLWAKAASVPEEIVEAVSEAVGDHYVEATKVYRQRTEAWQLMLFSWKNLAKVKRKQRPLVKVEAIPSSKYQLSLLISIHFF